MSDKGYLPYNLSRLLPSDSTLAALRELPGPQPHAPNPGFASEAPIEMPRMDNDILQSMANILAKTAEQSGRSLAEDGGLDADKWKVRSDVDPPVLKELCQLRPELLASRTRRALKPKKRPRSESHWEEINQANGFKGEHVITNCAAKNGSISKSDRVIEFSAELKEVRGKEGASNADSEEHGIEESALAFQDNERRKAMRRAQDDSLKAFVETMEECCDALDKTSSPCETSHEDSLILELCHSIEVHCAMGLSSHVSESLLLRVIDTLERTITRKMSRVERLNSRAVPQDCQNATFIGVQCCSAVLCIMTSPKASSGVLLEDVLEVITEFLREVCVRIIFPFYDPIFDIPPTLSSGEKQCGGSREKHLVPSPSEVDFGENTAFFALQRDQVQKRPSQRSRGYRQVRVEDIFRNTCFAFDRLAILMGGNCRLSDTAVAKVIALAALPMNIADVTALQLSAYRVTCGAFKWYLQHRGLIIDYVREQVSKLPTARRNLRTFQLLGSKRSVRIGSALLAQLVQIAGGGSENQQKCETIAFGNPASTDEVDDNRILQQAAIVAHDVISNILTRALRERDADYLFTLQTLFQDLSEMYTLPEWPAAEVLLRVMFVHLLKRIQKPPDKSKGDVYARGFAYELFGALASRMRDLQKMDNFSQHENSVTKHRAAVVSFLGEQFRSNIDPTARYALEFWQIQIRKELRDSYSRLKKEAKEWKLEDHDDNEEHEQVDEMEKRELDILSKAVPDADESRIERASANMGSLHLHLSRDFVTLGYQSALEAIVRGLSESAPTLRTKAIKALAAVHDTDPTVIRSLPMLQKAVTQSCMDVSTIVRDAALDLLSGSFQVNMPEQSELSSLGYGNASVTQPVVAKYGTSFFKGVYPIVVRRLLDTATSVRKRALKILQNVIDDILSQETDLLQKSLEPLCRYQEQSPEEDLIVDICSKVISRMDDAETSVKDLSRGILARALFHHKQPVRSDGNEKTDSRLAPLLASRLVGVCMRLPPASHKRFISRLLDFGLLDNIRGKLVLMVSHIVCDLQYIEARSAELCAKEEKTNELDTLLKRQVSCASVLAGLTNADASLLAPHCVALAPSIKVISQAPNTADILCTQSVLFVLEVGISKMKTVSESYVADVLRDLESLVCQQPSSIIGQAAVRCLSAYDRYADETCVGSCQRLISLFSSFLSSQRASIADFEVNDRKGIQNTRVALVRLGLLNRYADVAGRTVDESFEILLCYCRETTKGWMYTDSEDVNFPREASTSTHPFREESLRGLTHLLIRHLHYLPKSAPVFRAGLRQGKGKNAHCTSDYCTQLRIITDFQELLMQEEERNSKNGRSCETHIEKTSKNLAAEDDAEAGYLAGFAQTLLPDLLSISTSPDRRIRSRIASVLGLLVRQGLILPASIVPTLFGFMVDSEETLTRNNSLRVVTFIAERYPHMLASGTIRGINFAHDVWHALPKRGSCFTDNYTNKLTGMSILSPVISLVPRAKRRSIMAYLVKEFDPHVVLVRSESVASSNSNLSDGSSCTLEKSPLKELIREKTIKLHKTLIVKSNADMRSLSLLGFQATVLATMEYGTTGKVKGGGGSTMGGTAAHEQTLKRAREEIGDVIHACSRVISGSGQILYEVLKSISKREVVLEISERMHLIRLAISLTMVLLIKRYLKFTRANAEKDRSVAGHEEDLSSAGIHIPDFELPAILLQTFDQRKDGEKPNPNDVGTEQLEYFMKLMKEDALDNSEYMYGSEHSPSRKRRLSRKSGTEASLRKRIYKSPTRSEIRNRSSCYVPFKKTTRYSINGYGDDNDDDDPRDADFLPS